MRGGAASTLVGRIARAALVARPQREGARSAAALPPSAAARRVIPCPLCDLKFTLGRAMWEHLDAHSAQCAKVATSSGPFLLDEVVATSDAAADFLAATYKKTGVIFKTGSSSKGRAQFDCPNFQRSRLAAEH